MAVSLYRKYRSKSLDEIVGQKGVVTALKSAIAKQSISHAYLFTGPRGVGKTSIARILAFAINDIPYDINQLPIDIIEIDAASNRGIDEIRDLREKVRIAPVSSKYKVYIIDEVHMLTTPSFNALLKTLEEPPEHVVFILATTESHKLPETIVSRTQHYNFKLATTAETVDHLTSIVKQEKIVINKDAIKLIAKHSGGSMRDALSLLDHARHLGDKISIDDVRSNIGLSSEEVITDIIDALATNNAAQILSVMHDAEQDNVSAVSLSKQLLYSLKIALQQNENKLSLARTTKLMKSLAGVETSNQPELQLNIALLENIDTDAPPAVQVVVAPISTKAPKTVAAKATSKVVPKETVKKNVNPSASPAEPPVKKDESKANEVASSTNDKPAKPNTNSEELTHDMWKIVLEDLRASHNTLYSILRKAQLDLSEIGSKKITFNFRFAFHQKRLIESKNRSVVASKLAAHGYDNIEVNYEVAQKNANTNETSNSSDDDKVQVPPQDSIVNQISNVFGSAELME